MTPSIERFRALARSAPWRWSTLRFQARWHDRDHAPVRAWVRRPDGLRVERMDGSLLVAERQPPHPTATPLSQGGDAAPLPPRTAMTVQPRLDEDGLVADPPDRCNLADDPMYLDYSWVAMLAPVELADGDTGMTRAPAAMDEPAEVDHHGRAAWEAVLRPRTGYRPRCPCCALLFCEAVEAALGVPTASERDPAFRYPEAHRIRLDVGTGVCVLASEVGGSRPGSGHELIIETVDEPLDDVLFQGP